ncbi:MAG TPA: serine/threonine-protein kinase [Roseiflexaceae bacterium]|nr:serine/threonine-protein kinase [Roseiflexaceae bacterium]
MIDQIAQSIGDYTLDEVIGVGELGEVSRATDTRTGQVRAFKLIHADVAVLPGFSERFRQTVEELSLQHAHIITIFEQGDHQERPFVVMELASSSFVQLLQRHKRREKELPLRSLVALVRQGIEALIFAHAQGIKHLNLKPSNLLLVDDPASNESGSGLTLKLSDFGLFRQAEDVLEYPTKVVDSLAYRPPEWFLDQPLDERSDVYGLGVILYEATTGYLPFKAKTFNAAWQTHFSQQRPPDVRKVNAKLPEGLAQLIMRCLEHDPDNRYNSVTELATGIDELINSGALEPPPAPPPTRQLTLPNGGVVSATIIKPRVTVMDQEGKPIRAYDLTGEGLNISADPSSDIVLPDGNNAPQNVQIDWTGNRATVTSLRDAQSVRLEDRELKTDEARPWTPGTLLQVGTVWLSLEAVESTSEAVGGVQGANGAVNGNGAATYSPWGAAGAVAAGTVALGNGMVEGISGVQSEEVASTEATVTRIVLLPDETDFFLMVTPGTPEQFRFTLVNNSRIVDNYRITVSGEAPESWVVLPPKPVKLNPGDRTIVRLTVNIPPLPSSLAKDYNVTIHATSVSDQNETGTLQTTWRVLPFSKPRAPEIAPRSATRYVRSQLFIVSLRNESNTPITYTSEMEEHENLYFKLIPNTPVRVEPGKVARIKLKVTPKQWIWFSSGQKYRFTMFSKIDGQAEPFNEVGVYDQQPLIGILRWFLMIPFMLGSFAYLFALLPIDRKRITTPFYGIFNPPTATAVVLPTVDPVLLLIPTLPPPTDPPAPTDPPTPTSPPPPTPLPPTPVPPPPTPTIGPLCFIGEPFEVSGQGPASSGLLLLFDNRPVGGGTTDASGRYKLILRVGNEQRGRHLVTVRSRPGNQIVRQFTCIVP